MKTPVHNVEQSNETFTAAPDFVSAVNTVNQVIENIADPAGVVTEFIRHASPEEVREVMRQLNPEERRALLKNLKSVKDALAEEELQNAKGVAAHLSRNKWRYGAGLAIITAAVAAVVVVRRRNAAAEAVVAAAEAAVGTTLT